MFLPIKLKKFRRDLCKVENLTSLIGLILKATNCDGTPIIKRDEVNFIQRDNSNAGRFQPSLIVYCRAWPPCTSRFHAVQTRGKTRLSFELSQVVSVIILGVTYSPQYSGLHTILEHPLS